MKPHFRKLLHLPSEEDPPPFLQPPTVSAALPPSASIRKPPRPPLINAPFDSSVSLTVLVLLTALFFMGFFSLYIHRFAEGAEAAASSRRRRRRSRIRRDPVGTSPSPPRSSRAPPERPSCSAPHKGLDPAVIRSLPVFAYGEEGAKYQADCPVCLSDFEEEEEVKAIPRCSHVFHAECIDRWLCAHASCPVCRDARLTEASGRAEAGGTEEGSSAAGGRGVRSAGELEGRSTATSGGAVIGDGGGEGLSARGRSRSWSSVGESSFLWRTMSL